MDEPPGIAADAGGAGAGVVSASSSGEDGGDLDPFARIPGDATGDGRVNGADYTVWADHYLASGVGPSEGDFDGDGSVGDADYAIWAADYGEDALLQTEWRCDVDGDGDFSAADVSLLEAFLLGTATPNGWESVQSDVHPVGAPDGWLDADDYDVMLLALESSPELCEVPLTLVRALDDMDDDGVLRIACLGDSNTCLGTPGTCEGVTSWCAHWEAMLPEAVMSDGRVLPTEFQNQGVGGTTVCPHGAWRMGPRQYVLAVDRPEPGPADVVVMAFGTNDWSWDSTPQEVVDCYTALMDQAEIDGVLAYVAFTPASASAERNLHAAATNDILRATLPLDRLVDFATDFDAAELFLPDHGVHFNEEGQRLRADRTRDAVR